MKVTMIPIVDDLLDTILKSLLRGLEDLEIGGQTQIIQTTTC